jgi:hypothetical protein
MTISSTVRVAGPFIGNGTASVFPFAFKVFTATDLDVIRLASSTGVETTLVLNSDYSVTLNGDQNSNPGGSITLLAGALASGFTLTITSDIANLQPTDLTNQGGFYPEVITDSLDRATIQIQQISDIGDRTLKIPISDGTGLNMELPTAAARANAFLSFDANGEPTVVAAGSSGAPTTITRQVFSGTGSQTVFTLASDPGALGNSAQVYIGGVYQQRSTYTIAGTTLTFSQAPVAGTDNIEFVNFLTSNIGATSADLVTYTPAGSGAVARSAASKFGDVVSVKDFGAVGDGVADDTAAIQNAVNASTQVYFPAGTYKCDGIVTLDANSNLFGAGRGATRIVRNGTNSASVGVFYAQSASSTTFIDNITIRDMTIDGQVATLGFSAFRHLVSLNGVRNVVIERVDFVGFRGDGVYIGSGSSAGLERHNHNVTVRDCLFDGVNSDNRNGISVIDGNGITIQNNTFRNCSRNNMPGPIDIEPDANAYHVVRDIDILDNRIESYAGSAAIAVYTNASVLTTPISGIRIVGNYIEGAQKPSGAVFIYVTTLETVTSTTPPMGVVISNNYMRDTNGVLPQPIVVNRVRGLLCDGNTIEGGNVSVFGTLGAAVVRNMDFVVARNVFRGSGGVNGAILFNAISNLLIDSNVIDSPAAGTSTIGIRFLGDGVTGVSNNVRCINNTFIKGTSQTTSFGVFSHTLDRTTNTEMGTRVIGGSLTDQFLADYGGAELYTTGTWTPVIAVTGYTFTYGLQQGTWTRIGNLVLIAFRVEITGLVGVPTSSVTITGLPFAASASLATAAYSTSIMYANLDIPAGYTTVAGLITPGSQTLNLRQLGDNVANVALSNAALTATTELTGSFIYQV